MIKILKTIDDSGMGGYYPQRLYHGGISVPFEKTLLDRWFLYPDLADADVALFCLPHSGGGATAYKDWPAALPPTIAVRSLQPPGRESRLGEPPELDIGEIAEVISLERRPFSLYGHSLGGLLAFEVARELMRRGARLPERLFVGACRAPSLAAAQAAALMSLSDVEFVDAVIAMGGTPEEIKQEPFLVELLMRLLRSDFGWMARHSHRPDPILPVPVIGIAAAADPVVSAAEMAGWAAVTSAGFIQHTVPGGHFFAQQQIGPLARILLREWPRA
jgi:surfactin synthase thioesterase subunit